jgi:hypothetical protein
VGEGSNRGTRDVGLRLVGRGAYLECGEGGCRADQNNAVERRSHDFITSALGTLLFNGIEMASIFEAESAQVGKKLYLGIWMRTVFNYRNRGIKSCDFTSLPR